MRLTAFRLQIIIALIGSMNNQRITKSPGVEKIAEESPKTPRITKESPGVEKIAEESPKTPRITRETVLNAFFCSNA